MDISPILEFLMPDELKKALMEWRNDHYSFAVFLFFEFLVGFVLIYFCKKTTKRAVLENLKAKNSIEETILRKRITRRFCALFFVISFFIGIGVFGYYYGKSRTVDPVESLSVGDHFPFGNYKQGTNGEVKPIEWRVLAVEDGKALLISERLLDCVKYNNTRQSVTWETCTLRKWMNNDFLNKAFTESEQARIATVTNTNSNNPEYNTTGGESTDDKIFALSFDEAEMYFKSDDDRLAAPTGYAKKRGAWANESHTLDNGGNPGWWWLRSPGHGGSLAVFVRSKGDISTYGTDVINSPGSVRPAMWLIL